MCDYFWQRMESDHGDLADIVRAGGQIGPPSNAAAAEFEPLENGGWPLQHPPETVFGLPPPPPPSRAKAAAAPGGSFGDPFVSLRDPLLNPYAGVLDFFDGGCGGGGAESAAGRVAMESSGCGGGEVEAMFLASPKVMMAGGGCEQQRAELAMKTAPPCAILSKANHQISPAGISRPSPLSPRLIKPSPMAVAEMMKASGAGAMPGPMDHGYVGSGGVQISSPRTPGIKRRKSQAKKVVCIPAPAAASCNNRPSGEVVPSDLWAWRKYGQKPIKGSPYPRGYYRCSSSKGCSARKQVERSRTDPNMLVITYTSEHNHPWPTQRNALAGSIRSHPSKNSASKSSAASAHNDSPLKLLPTTPGEEAASSAAAAAAAAVVKEEEEVSEMERVLEEADGEFDQIYKPMIPESDQPDDFFSDLAELESDPMSLIFSKGFMEDGGKAAAAAGEAAEEEEEEGDHSQRGEKAALDAFNVFDWGGSS